MSGSNNMNVALILSLQDRITAANRRAQADLRREFKQTEQQMRALATAGRTVGTARPPASMLTWLRNAAREANVLGRALSGVRATLRALPSAIAGYQAAKYVLADPVRKTMDYDLRLAQMSNTAFTDRDTAGRRAGMQELNAAAVHAVRTGGGTRDQAAETLDTLIASGAMSNKDAIKILPTLQRYSTASGADPNQLANIAIRGMQSFKIAADEMPRLLDMAITAGQAGGFELKDMAKWLPQQMAAARLSGLTGMPGMAKLLAANQATAITAGTKDEAGNNLVNLLAKINSRDTATDAKRLGIDLPGTLAAARGKGMNSLDAFVALVDRIASSDKQYVSLRKKAAASGDDTDRRATYESMGDILQGSAIGKMIQDRQALMALIGLMNNRDYLKDVEAKVNAGAGAGERNFATIQGTAAFQAQQLGAEKEIGLQNALDRVNPLLGEMAGWLVQSARNHPIFASAVAAATLALTALAAAAGAAGLMSLVRGGGVAAAGAAGAGGAATGAAATAGGGLLAKMGTGAAMLFGAKSLGSIASMGAGAMATSAALVGGAGAAGYGVGTGIDWGLGKLISLFTGREETLGGLISDFTHKEIPIAVTVDVRGGNIVAEVNRVNSFEARRN